MRQNTNLGCWRAHVSYVLRGVCNASNQRTHKSQTEKLSQKVFTVCRLEKNVPKVSKHGGFQGSNLKLKLKLCLGLQNYVPLGNMFSIFVSISMCQTQNNFANLWSSWNSKLHLDIKKPCLCDLTIILSSQPSESLDCAKDCDKNLYRTRIPTQKSFSIWSWSSCY